MAIIRLNQAVAVSYVQSVADGLAILAQVATQLDRVPGVCPTLKMLRHPASIYDYHFDDFELVGYDPAPNISAPVAI